MEFDNYNKLIEAYMSNYIREFGERSSYKTIMKIKNSKHTKNLLQQSVAGRFVPNSGDFGSFVLSNMSFSFAITSKVTFASIVLLNIWHEQINKELNLASEYELIELFNRIKNEFQ